MKRFIVINEPFICQNCKESNPLLKGSCRNHCRKCLCSLHLDEKTPGDRKSNCKEIMEPITVSKNGKKGWIIHHKCTKCNKIIKNKAAKDDNFQLIIKLSSIPNHEQTGNKKNRSKNPKNT